jgi:hypothetical protein
MLMSDKAEVRDQALQVARGWSPAGAPESWRLTAALFDGIARQDDLLERLAELPPDRLPGLLGGAAVRFLARRDNPEPLATYFPVPYRPQPDFDDGFFAAFAEFCSSRLDDISAVCWDHRYQMNEVARCAQIAVGVAATVTPFDDRIGLVDLGTGAGLGLHLDRYRYRIGAQPWVGPKDAGVSVECRLRGSAEPPAPRLPEIVERLGIDIDPVNVEDTPTRAWLEACAPPEAGALTRLATAVEVARSHPSTIVSGDVVDVLPDVLARMPRGLSIVVVDAYTAVFLPPDRRRLLADVLAEAASTVPVTWLSLDPLVPLGPSGRDSVQGIEVPDALVNQYHQHGVFALLGARTFRDSTDRGRLLARGHPSGAWVEWLGDENAGL